MNKKMILIVTLLVSVMILTPAMGIVSAGKGQEKIFFRIDLITANEPGSERIIRCSPKWETPPAVGGDANVVFVEIEYTASDLSVTVGTDPITPSDVELTDGVVDGMWYWNVPIPFSKVIEKDEFILDFSGYFGTTAKIEIKRVGEKNQNDGIWSGTFVGHGTDFLKGVKVSGTQTSYITSFLSNSIELTGTVVGWPELP